MKTNTEKIEFYEGQEVKVLWYLDGLVEKHNGEIICNMVDIGFGDDDKWLVEIREDNDEYQTRMIKVWDDEMFPIKEGFLYHHKCLLLEEKPTRQKRIFYGNYSKIWV